MMPPAELVRLRRLCGLLASDYDGERATAARMATALLRRLGLRWADVVHPPCLPPPEWRELVDLCLSYRELLSEWEIDFLENLRSFKRISDKQTAVLERLVAKCGGPP